MTYININDTVCYGDEKCCWSCINHSRGWSFSECNDCLVNNKKYGKYNNWIPREFDRKELEAAAIDCLMT